jgi:DNA ligase-associated metallophosphoesterase
MKPESISVRKQQLWLSAERTIFWEQEKALIVSDLHFGKTGHFRKSGIAVPQSVYKEDLQRLVSQIQFFQPSQLIVVGDLFHSKANKELEWFLRWRNDFPDLVVHLVKGNHDILQDKWYASAAIDVSLKSLTIGDFCFQHDQNDCENEDDYLFSGHVHPGIRINGIGKQSLQFPCFYFSSGHCILPAFSKFTGTALIDYGDDDLIFAIVNNSLIRM